MSSGETEPSNATKCSRWMGAEAVSTRTTMQPHGPNSSSFAVTGTREPTSLRSFKTKGNGRRVGGTSPVNEGSDPCKRACKRMDIQCAGSSLDTSKKWTAATRDSNGHKPHNSHTRYIISDAVGYGARRLTPRAVRRVVGIVFLTG